MGFAVEAIRSALDDAGLKPAELDGLLVQPGVAWRTAEPATSWMANTELQEIMGLRDLRLIASMNLGGATAGAMVAYAAQCVAAGMANAVACVFADDPLKPPEPGVDSRTGAAYGQAFGINASYGFFGAVAGYGMVAKRHMELYGTTSEQFGAVAVAQRKWANMNPAAYFYNAPLTIEDYFNSRWISEPFRLLDCCLVSNGGICVIVTSAERARDLKKPPVYILGAGQGHPGGDPVDRLASGAGLAKEVAFKMAGIALVGRQPGRAVRLLHLYRDRDPGRLRLLSQGRGRAVRRRRTYRTRRLAPGQHRRRPVKRLLSVGHDAAVRSGYPGPGRGRRAPGEEARYLPGLRQWRASDHPFDPGSEHPPGPHSQAQSGGEGGRGQRSLSGNRTRQRKRRVAAGIAGHRIFELLVDTAGGLANAAGQGGK